MNWRDQKPDQCGWWCWKIPENESGEFGIILVLKDEGRFVAELWGQCGYVSVDELDGQFAFVSEPTKEITDGLYPARLPRD